ncbi:phage minor head protein [Halopseudomonas pachastrellae]|nr:phage minor head protein [Halopseudomonas pachastrellae]
MAARLADAVARMDGQSFAVQYLERMLASVRELNAQTMASVAEQVTTDMVALGQYELDYQDRLFTTVIPAPALAVAPLAGVTLEQVRQIAFSRPFQGKLLSEWLSDIEAARAARIRDAIRVGMTSGLTNDQIVRSIMGIRSEGYADGLLNRSRAGHRVDGEDCHRACVAGRADQFYAANDDLVASVKWLSTLDSRTSPDCRLRDGLRYSNDHKPSGTQCHGWQVRGVSTGSAGLRRRRSSRFGKSWA